MRSRAPHQGLHALTSAMPEATSASDLDARISSTGWSLVDFGDCIRIYTNTRFPDEYQGWESTQIDSGNKAL